MIELDFSLQTSQERKEYVDKYITGRNFTNKEVETMANYILYGKDIENTSPVDRKEIQIDTKYGSYKTKRPDSLEELLENPNFNEQYFVKTTNYKKPKPKIDRELDKDVPGIQELWKTIDYYQHLVDVYDGKVEDPNARKLTQTERYKLKHHIIELRREQFTLRDMVKPTLFFGSPIRDLNLPAAPDILWDTNPDFSIAPLGLITANKQRFYNFLDIEEYDYQYNKESKFILDFRNPLHIYQLIEFYEDFLIAAEDRPESLLDDIIQTLEFYIELAELNPVKTEILRLKKIKTPVIEIQKVLKEKYGASHSTNYISTIFKQKICGDIADAADLHYNMYMERENRSMWKKCKQCGELKFLDPRVFMRKTRSSDGYNSKCKKCCKENREKSKV